MTYFLLKATALMVVGYAAGFFVGMKIRQWIKQRSHTVIIRHIHNDCVMTVKNFTLISEHAD